MAGPHGGLDPPREMPGAASHILHTLEAFGFEWDGEVAYQSRRYALYEETLCRLQTAGLVYPCHCSRKDWQAAAVHGADRFVYNGRCRNPQQRPALQGKQPAWRIRVPDRDIGFSDGIVGGYAQTSPATSAISSCFVQTVTGHTSSPSLPTMPNRALHRPRTDLLVSTPRQIYLQQCLGVPTPQYAHLPLLTNAQGQK